MNECFYRLNIEKPNELLEKEIMRCANEAPLDTFYQNNHKKLQDRPLNVISRQFEKEDDIVIKLAKEQYQHLFDEEIFPVVGILTNVDPDEKYACWPPHSDRERIFCTNYYYELGGDNVTTVFYKQITDHIPGLGTGRVWKYEEIDILEEVHFDLNQWYGLSVRRAHSIEKVENRRIIFSLSFYEITFDDFRVKYPQYILD
jgi:hypothetical protein